MCGAAEFEEGIVAALGEVDDGDAAGHVVSLPASHVERVVEGLVVEGFVVEDAM